MRGSFCLMRDIVANLIRRHIKITAHPYEGLPVIVVSGVGRSGTTVLRHCLSAHPDLHSTDSENNVIYDVLETARHNCTYPSRRGTMRVAPPAYDRQWRLLLLNLLWPEPRRGRYRPRKLLAASDLLPERAEYLYRVFPGVRIIYIVRNGIAVVSSRMAHPNFRQNPFEEHCRRWAAARDMALWGASRSGFVLFRQEDALDSADAERACRRMLEQLDLTFCRECLRTLTQNRYHPTVLGEESREEAEDLAQRSERWRLWSDEQREEFADICREAMRYFEYTIPWREED